MRRRGQSQNGPRDAAEAEPCQQDDLARAKAAFHGTCHRALAAWAEGQAEQASAALDEALALADAMPAEEDVQQAAAKALLQLGRLAEAALYLEGQLARTGADDAGAACYATLAQVYLRLGRLREAVSLAQAAPRPHGQALLVLGSALRYRGRLEQARAPLREAFTLAQQERDLALAVAALHAQGELELDAGGAKEAVVIFGRALGLTEHSQDETLSVLPLAGLAQAHGAWGYPSKGRALAEKALERAPAADRAARARVLLTLGLLSGELVQLARALAEADLAPHLPLALKCLVAFAEREPSALKLAEAMRLARELGMDLDVHRLEAAARVSRQNVC